MGEVIEGRFMTTLDIPPEKVLDAAKKHELDTVFVLGEKDGELYMACSSADIGRVLWLIERFKRAVIE
jgi:hypothetical protein